MIANGNAEIIKRVCVELTNERGVFNMMQVMNGLAQFHRSRCPTTSEVRVFISKQDWIERRGRVSHFGVRLSIYSVKDVETEGFDVLAETRQESEIIA